MSPEEHVSERANGTPPKKAPQNKKAVNKIKLIFQWGSDKDVIFIRTEEQVSTKFYVRKL